MPGERHSIVYSTVGPEPYIDITFTINIRQRKQHIQTGKKHEYFP